MRKLHLAALVLFLITLSTNLTAQSTATLDTKFGFQKFKFNTPPSHYSQFNLRQVDGEKYSIGNVVSITIGDYEVEKGELYFHANQLYRIDIQLDDLERTKNVEIYNALVDNYGRPTTSNAFSTFDGTRAQQTIWKGEDVTLKYTLKSFREGSALQTKIVLSYYIDTSKTTIKSDL